MKKICFCTLIKFGKRTIISAIKLISNTRLTFDRCQEDKIKNTPHIYQVVVILVLLLSNSILRFLFL